jgi:hypothetical protein
MKTGQSSTREKPISEGAASERVNRYGSISEKCKPQGAWASRPCATLVLLRGSVSKQARRLFSLFTLFGDAPNRSKNSTHGYSLIEVLIAAGILLTGITAAAMMAHTMFLQTLDNGRVTRAINLQEQAATLWQLGLDPDTITDILPERCVDLSPPGADAMQLIFTNEADITAVGTQPAESVTLQIVFHAANQTDGTLIYRTNDVTVVRPSTR